MKYSNRKNNLDLRVRLDEYYVEIEGGYFKMKPDHKFRFQFGDKQFVSMNFPNGQYNGYGYLTIDSDSLYSGYFKNGKFHGLGTLIYDLHEYKGEFKDNKFNGNGKLSCNIENSSGFEKLYEGEFLDNKFNGKGKYTFDRYNQYIGDFKNDQFHGHGILTKYNGDKYIGEFRNNKYNGVGILNVYCNYKYEGTFTDDKFNGEGCLTFSNGKTYLGTFVMGKFSDEGNLITPNREINNTFFNILTPLRNSTSKYIHSFIENLTSKSYSEILPIFIQNKTNNDEYEILIVSDHEKQNIYDYRNGNFNGIAILVFLNGKLYIGEFKDNKPHGQGEMIHPFQEPVNEQSYYFYNNEIFSEEGERLRRKNRYMQHKRYVGLFQYGKYQGKGELEYHYGSKYIGEFKNDRLNGYGEIKLYNGKAYTGFFEEDDFHGNGTLTYPDTKKYIGEFKNGVFNGVGEIEIPYGPPRDDDWHLTYLYYIRYKGDFKYGYYNGFGSLFFPYGKEYHGEFSAGQICGTGKLVVPNIFEYIGQFSGEKFHGNGKITYPNGKNNYDNFENYFKNITEYNYSGQSGKDTPFQYGNYEEYTGEFKDNKYCGHGTLLNIIGDGEEIRYTGEFENDLYSGIGKLEVFDHFYDLVKIYEGQFKLGVYHGRGKLTYPKGSEYYMNRFANPTNCEEYIGIFVDGDFIGGSQIGNDSISEIENNNKFYLFFDTETNGLPKNWNAPISDLNNWPRLVQLAFILYDDESNIISKGDYIIKPDDFVISSESAKIHTITNEKAIKEGYNLSSVLEIFSSLIEKSDFIIAHNISFDEYVVGAEFLRIGMQNKFSNKKKICTMKSTIDYCAISGPNGLKWPKLSELYFKLFSTELTEVHNAFKDIQATAKCYWELKKIGKI